VEEARKGELVSATRCGAGALSAGIARRRRRRWNEDARAAGAGFMLCLRGLGRKGTVEEPVDRIGSGRVVWLGFGRFLTHAEAL
jgi:hypothetical protein